MMYNTISITNQVNLQMAQTEITVDRNQADLLLWCIEQTSIDLTDVELYDLKDIISKLDEVASSSASQQSVTSSVDYGS